MWNRNRIRERPRKRYRRAAQMAECARIPHHLNAERAQAHRLDPHAAQARHPDMPAFVYGACEHRRQNMRAAVEAEHHGKHGEKAEARRDFCVTDPKRHRL